MSIDSRTNAFLKLADENRDLANRLINDDVPPLRWISVIAFYSAVHYIGAYVWAHDRREISNHEERDVEVHRDLELRRIAPYYLRLFDHGFKARYKAYYKERPESVAELLNVDLAAIEKCVRDALPDTDAS
ncbi:MAG: hypothetical protein EA415_11105 [Sphaerobacteraceae bacterium]|nr:MAG: hypothetical protein EA415_11105 [Sphaerobacteraceae bacterium]